MKHKAAALLLCLLALAAGAGDLRGRVVGIVDGDTLDLLTAEKQTIRLRLHGIDCPERGQAYGAAAKTYTAAKCAGAAVLASVVSTDRNGRSVADVSLPNGESLNRELVRAGLAWWEPRFSKDKTLEALEAEARAARRGLWADLDTKAPPVRPSEYRKPKGTP